MALSRYAEMPLRCSKYTDSFYTYPKHWLSPAATYLNPSALLIYCPQSQRDFETFSKREQRKSTAIFGHRDDPEFQRLVSMATPLASQRNKLILVDVGTVPDLGAQFRIDRPKVYKVFNGLAQSKLKQNPTRDCLRRFMCPPSVARWRPTIW